MALAHRNIHWYLDFYIQNEGLNNQRCFAMLKSRPPKISAGGNKLFSTFLVFWPLVRPFININNLKIIGLNKTANSEQIT